VANSGSVVTRKVVEYMNAGESGLGRALFVIAEETGVELAPIPPAHVTDRMFRSS